MKPGIFYVCIWCKFYKYIVGVIKRTHIDMSPGPQLPLIFVRDDDCIQGPGSLRGARMRLRETLRGHAAPPADRPRACEKNTEMQIVHVG